MKRIIVLSLVVLALYSCKKSKEMPAPMRLLDVPDCITLAEYDSLATNSQKAEWLRMQGNLVCDSILYARETIHEVPSVDVKVPATAQPYIMTWSEFQTLVGKTVYENYVGFEIDSSNNVTKVPLVPLYLETGNTYSVPLFRSIGVKYKFNRESKLEFVNAKVKDELMVVIRFKNEAREYVYYDFSTNPI